MAKTYSDKLKDPRWQKKRLDILNRDEFTCRFCSTDDKPLHVHHIHYESFNPWETRDSLLITLCEECHENETILMKGATQDLVNIIKSCGFTGDDFVNLIDGFWNLKQMEINPIEPISLSISNALTDRGVFETIMKLFKKQTEEWVKLRIERNENKVLSNEETF